MMRLRQVIRAALGLLAIAIVAGCAAPPTSPPAALKSERLGTAWGEDMASTLGRGDFRRIGSRPLAVEVIGYAAAALSGPRLAEVPMADDRLTLRLLREDGRPWPMARQNGRAMVQGAMGQRYVLEYTNRSTTDILEVVATVDGLDVVNGQPGSPRNPGHVLLPGQTVRIAGFRKSGTAVAAFRFSSVEGSYAAQSAAGSGANAGVIGTAVFRLARPGPLDCRTPPCAFGARAASEGFAPPPPGG